jgi:hypothetical protein
VGRLWTRRGCLAVGLALAIPAAARSAPARRIVAVGDLHGDFSAWRDIVRAARLVDDRGRWIGGGAILVQTGDAVDRGPDSRKIIQDLMRLQREASRAGGQVIALVGNHEAMNLTGDVRYVSAGDYAAYAGASSARLREAVFAENKAVIEQAYRQSDPKMTAPAIKQAWIDTTPLGSVEHQAAWSPDGEIGRWVVGNPAVVLLDGVLFVHGGISPAYAHLPVAEINRQVAAALRARTTARDAIINDPAGPLWFRGLAAPGVEAGETPAKASGAEAPPPPPPPIEQQLDSLLSAAGAKRIVIGHTPHLAGIEILFGGRLIRIDTGISAFYGGQVSYLDIVDGTPVPHAVPRSAPATG